MTLQWLEQAESFWRRANNTRTMRIPKRPNLSQAVLKSTSITAFPSSTSADSVPLS
jgi:hypothetical protein